MKLVERVLRGAMSTPCACSTSGPSPAPCDSERDVNGALNVHVLRAFGEVLLGLAEGGPVVIGVDDVHYADMPSLECLLYVVRRLRRTRIVLVLTECASFKREHQRFYAELLQQPHCRCVELPLGPHKGLRRLPENRNFRGCSFEIRSSAQLPYQLVPLPPLCPRQPSVRQYWPARMIFAFLCFPAGRADLVLWAAAVVSPARRCRVIPGQADAVDAPDDPWRDETEKRARGYARVDRVFTQQMQGSAAKT